MTKKNPQITHREISVPGPAGELEAILETTTNRASRIAIICHPHPLHEGTMNNKVVHTLARVFAQAGFAAIRFNFRGVGASAGAYANGDGETEDALAVADWAQLELPGLPLWFAGFSFGAYTALRASTQRTLEGLITIAPAVNLFNFRELPLPTCPWLVVQGRADDVVPAIDVQQWRDSLPINPQFIEMDATGHFFHGRLNDLSDNVRGFLRSHIDDLKTQS